MPMPYAQAPTMDADIYGSSFQRVVGFTSHALTTTTIAANAAPAPTPTPTSMAPPPPPRVSTADLGAAARKQANQSRLEATIVSATPTSVLDQAARNSSIRQQRYQTALRSYQYAQRSLADVKGAMEQDERVRKGLTDRQRDTWESAIAREINEVEYWRARVDRLPLEMFKPPRETEDDESPIPDSPALAPTTLTPTLLPLPLESKPPPRRKKKKARARAARAASAPKEAAPSTASTEEGASDVECRLEGVRQVLEQTQVHEQPEPAIVATAQDTVPAAAPATPRAHVEPRQNASPSPEQLEIRGRRWRTGSELGRKKRGGGKIV